MAHPAVRDAAVVGLPDPDLGQRVAGFVQLADSVFGVDLNEILAFATERLADYKVPETLEIVDHIPRNTLGKIDRRLLLTMISNGSPRNGFVSSRGREVTTEMTMLQLRLSLSEHWCFVRSSTDQSSSK